MEFQTWHQQDKHAQAYKALTDPLGKKMGEILGVDSRRDKRCLRCHATLYGEDSPPDVELKQGVTCESCHGPGKEWFLPHVDPSWRVRAPEDKERFGMIDVRDPVRRARLCFSCHIGETGRGRIVNHEMYAAGHPRLPGIEVETFVRALPPHWLAVSKKSGAVKNLLRYDPNEASSGKSVILSGVVALREAVQFLATRASSVTAGQSSWPDFALYNCHACHHDLTLPSWRQRRGYRGTPGNPQFWDWPQAVMKLAISQAAKDQRAYQGKKKEFTEKINRLHHALTSQPFGDPAKVGDPAAQNSASGDLLRWLDRLIAEVESRPYDQARALQSLRSLTILTEPGDPQYAAYPDYDSARQIAWAIISIYGDLKPKPKKDREISRLLEELNKFLGPELGGKPGAITNYDPNWFKVRLERLSGLLEQ